MSYQKLESLVSDMKIVSEIMIDVYMDKPTMDRLESEKCAFLMFLCEEKAKELYEAYYSKYEEAA